MLLRCHTAFGNHEPGDEIEVQDGSVFDRGHYEEAEPEPAKPLIRAKPTAPSVVETELAAGKSE